MSGREESDTGDCGVRVGLGAFLLVPGMYCNDDLQIRAAEGLAVVSLTLGTLGRASVPKWPLSSFSQVLVG